MLLLRHRGPILSISFVILGVVLGCGGRRADEESEPGPMPRLGSRSGAAGEMTPIKPGKAILRGKITIENPPDIAELNQQFLTKMTQLAGDNKGTCVDRAPKSQKEEQDWKIGSGNGLGQVFVYLRPAQDTSYFTVSPDDQRIKEAGLPEQERERLFQEDLKNGRAPELSWKTSAVIDQPHCVYLPHVQRFLPFYRDPSGKEVKNAQKLRIDNHADIGHNVKFPSGDNKALASGTDVLLDYLKPEYTPYTISCSIHPWMNANILVLDHPYSAITNEKGEFEIKDAPVGKVQLIVWHSRVNFITKNKARGEPIELKEDAPTVKDFTVPYSK